MSKDMEYECLNHEDYLHFMKDLYHKMEKVMDKKRFIHTIGVANTAACMAMRFDEDPYKAYLAGLLHDNAKCIESDKKKAICKKYELTITPAEKKNPDLLHAKVGSVLAKEKYDIEDEGILLAIRYHTTGRPEMTTLEKIVYIADYIEMNRKILKNIDQVRTLAFSDLDLCMFTILEGIIKYLKENDYAIDDISLETFSYFEKKINKNKEI